MKLDDITPFRNATKEPKFFKVIETGGVYNYAESSGINVSVGYEKVYSVHKSGMIFGSMIEVQDTLTGDEEVELM